MTRINTGIHPTELSRQHLIAEHREIKRIPNQIKVGKLFKNRDYSKIPSDFKLGAGHVMFFADKLKYLHKRYKLILKECRARGYNMTDYNDAWDGVPSELYNDWKETPESRSLIQQRILERTKESNE